MAKVYESDFFNIEVLEALSKENTEFREILQGLLLKAIIFYNTSESMFCVSPEKYWMRMEAYNLNRQKVVRGLLYLNSNFTDKHGNKPMKFVKGVKSASVQKDIVEEFYWIAVSAGLCESEKIQDVLARYA